MNKLNIAVVFGGMSTEHNVSIASGTAIMKNLDAGMYNIYPVYISEDGVWNTYNVDLNKTKQKKVGEKLEDIEPINNIFEYFKQIDVIFPVLHGLYGEDGSIQGLFELLKKPYVGCKILSSSVGMDKVYTKLIFEKCGLHQARYAYIRKYNEKYIYINKNFNEQILDLNTICKKLEEELGFPMFVKPSNSGSSVGINKSKNIIELASHIEHAAQFDNKILIEENISGRELECSVLGNEEVIASCVGEVKAVDEFYSYDAKYMNDKSYTIIPAEIPGNKAEEIKKAAIKAYKAIDGKGLSRVDFFLEKNTNKVYVNEINTLPGFTQISMYPKLFEQAGIEFKELLNRLIKLALE